MKVIVEVVIEIDNKIKKRLTVFGIACIVSMFTKWFGSCLLYTSKRIVLLIKNITVLLDKQFYVNI